MTPEAALSQTITTYEQAAVTNPTEVYSQPDPGEVSRAYESFILTKKAEKLVGTYGGACVSFARVFTGAAQDVVGGMARNVATNTTTPDVGEIVKTDESSAGHLEVIIAIDQSGNWTVVDSNYHLDGIVHIRSVRADSPKILGFININSQ